MTYEDRAIRALRSLLQKVRNAKARNERLSETYSDRAFPAMVDAYGVVESWIERAIVEAGGTP